MKFSPLKRRNEYSESDILEGVDGNLNNFNDENKKG